MEQLIASGKRTVLYVCLLHLSLSAAFAQSPSTTTRCQVSSSPVQVRAEGLTERLGDILFQCSSSPGTVFSANLTLFFPVNVTNRVDASNLTRDAVVSVDLGGGFVPTAIAGQVASNSISFIGISYPAPPSGNFQLKISNVRGDIYQLGSASAVFPPAITASLSSTLALDQSQLTVAYPQPGVLSNLGSAGISCYGSPSPDTLDLPGLFAAGTAFASTRVTEGFASAFEARAPGLDSGTRFLVKYTGFPTTAHLYIPDAVAGSDALKPTAGGDLGLPQAVGQYTPGSGALVLVRVPDADATGAGGLAVAPPQGVGPVTLGSVSEVLLVNGSGYAVYEVAAANAAVQETAQFPTFISLPRYTPPAVAQETIALAPLSAVTTASATAPVPRFAAVSMQSDCQLLGNCAPPFVPLPKLLLEAALIQLSAAAGGAIVDAPGTFRVRNDGGGSMPWSISVIYQDGAGWLVFDPPSGTNDATVRVTANTTTLSAGVFRATLIVDAGVSAGRYSVPVILRVTAAPQPTLPPPAPVPPALTVLVSRVLNAASLQVAPMVAGSLGTLMGSHLSGKSVAVTFDGTPAPLLYASDVQINFQVPANLGSKTSASLVVTVDGMSSAPLMVPLSAAWPAVFPHGIFNQDNSENTTSAAAKSGDILQIFATGIPKLATVSAQIGDQKDLVPVYAGEAPTAPGVQQVNVAIPAGVTGPRTVLLCAMTGGQQYCSTAYAIAVQ